MNSNIDFVTRAHALWRVRMAQWQQRFRFFSTITLGAAGAGAFIAPQFLLHGPAMTTAVQYAWANVLTLLGSLGGSDIKMNIAMEGQRWTVSAAWFASEPLFTDTFLAGRQSDRWRCNHRPCDRPVHCLGAPANHVRTGQGYARRPGHWRHPCGG